MNPEPATADSDVSQTAQTSAGMTSKVVKGTLWTLFGMSVPILFSLVSTPIVTRLLGAESYGLYILVLLIPSYLSFADFGMNIASTKFGSAAYAEGDREKEARIVRTAALIALATSLPLAILMAALAPSIVGLFKVPEHLFAEAASAVRIAALVFILNFLNNIFNTPELSRLRMDLNIMISSGVRMAGMIATPLVVYLGGGVIGAVTVAACVSALTLAGHILVSWRLLPELAGFSIDRGSIRPLARFGWSLVIAGIAAVLLVNLEKFVLTRATSVETLAYYSIAATFAAMLTLFSSSIVQSLMPAFSQLQGDAGRPALNALYSRGIRLTLVWLVPAVVFMVLAGRPFFTYWFGPDFGRESTPPFYIIVAGLFFNVLAYFPYAALMAAGRSDLLAKIYWIQLVPYILLVWFLANRFGAPGAAAAWTLRVITDTLMLFWLAHRVGGVSYIHPNMGYFAAAVAAMLVPLAALAFYGGLNVLIIASALAAGALYALVIWKKGFAADETDWIRQKLRSLLGTPA